MIAKIALIAVSPIILLGALLGATGVVLVDVRESGPDNCHFTIPVPLALAQFALSFAPEEARYIRCPEFARYQDLAIKVLHELEKAPDVVLVEVKDGGDHIVVRKDGKVIRVNVKDGSGEVVECALPIKGAIQAVEAYDGEGFPTKAAFWALRRAPRGSTLVHVKDGHDEVHIRRL